MGKKKAEAPPAPPTAAQSSEQSIQAQIAALPDILSAQKEFGPQFVAEQLAIESEFGPELAGILRDSIQALAPERIAGQELIRQELERPLDETLTPEGEQQFRADVRAATSQRGLGESGMAALEEIRQLTTLRNQLKQQRLALAQNQAGLVPSAPGFTIPQNQLVQPFTPSNFLQAQSLQQQGNIARYQALTGQQGGGLAGALGGGLSGAATGSAVGSALMPGIGTAVGAAVGGGAGLLGGYLG